MTNLVGVCRENHGNLRDKEVGVATVGPEVLCMASRADRFWGSPVVESAMSQVKVRSGVGSRPPEDSSQHCGPCAVL